LIIIPKQIQKIDNSLNHVKGSDSLTDFQEYFEQKYGK